MNSTLDSSGLSNLKRRRKFSSIGSSWASYTTTQRSRIPSQSLAYTHTRGYNAGGELLAKFWRISLYMAEDAIAKLYEYVT